MSKFKVGQLVWAMINGYPHWPGLVSEPPSDMSPHSKKNIHCVFFFGDDKYAWISESDLAPYNGCKDIHGGYKNNQFKKAVTAAEDFKKKKEAEILHGKGIFKTCRVVLRDVLSNQQEVVQTFGRKENTEMIRRPEVDLQARRGDKSVLVNRRQEDSFQAHGGDENVLMNRRMEAEILHGKGIFKPCRVVLRDVLSNQQEVVQTFGRKENTEMIRRPEVDLQARRGDKSVLVNRRQEDRFQAHGGDENVLMNRRMEAEILHGKGIFKPCRVVLRDVLSNQQEVVQTFGRRENTEMIRRPEVDLQARRGDKSVLVNRRQEDRFQAHGGDENVLMNRRMVQLEEDGIGQDAMLSGISGRGRPDAIDIRSHGFFGGEVSRTCMVWALILLLGVVAADLFYYLFY